MIESDDEIVSIGRALPLMASVKARDKFKVDVRWASGRSEVVDLAPDIFTFGTYAMLRDDRGLFETVHVVADGNALGWGDDNIIDMPATAIERMAQEAMTSGDLRAFLEAHRLTRDGLAAQLGISRRLVGYYLTERAIPRHIALACTALHRRLSPAP